MIGDQLSEINVHQLADKCRSKKELYHFLTQDGQVYLPRMDSTNIYFFKQILRGQKKWVCDVLYSLESEAIQQMINHAMEERRSKLEHSRDLIVEMRPEFADALNRCLNFSTERGKSANLMKNSSKRKRTFTEIEEVKEEEKEFQKDKQQYLQQTKRMKHENENMNDELLVLRRDKEQLISMFEAHNLGDQAQPFRM